MTDFVYLASIDFVFICLFAKIGASNNKPHQSSPVCNINIQPRRKIFCKFLSCQLLQYTSQWFQECSAAVSPFLIFLSLSPHFLASKDLSVGTNPDSEAWLSDLCHPSLWILTHVLVIQSLIEFPVNECFSFQIHLNF